MNASEAVGLKERSDSAVEDVPFPHVVLPGVLPAPVAAVAAHWMETAAAWRLETSSFYRQFGCRNMDDLATRLPSDLWAQLAARIEGLFNVTLSRERGRLSAHRLLPGQGIGIHNDNPWRGTETHRLVVTFTRNHQDRHGGHLVLFHRNQADAVAQIVRPLPGVGVAFPLSARSWHAVAEVNAGSRHSLIFSFWADGAPCELTDTVHGVKPHRTTVGDQTIPEGWRHVADFLERLGAGTVPHSGATLLDHLLSTGLLLESWGCPDAVCAGGMVHSVYGTASFRDALLSFDERTLLASVVGEAAERLAFRFADRAPLRSGLDRNAYDHDALRLIRRANHIEQTRRAAPDAS